MRRAWIHLMVLAVIFTGATLFILAPGSISWGYVLVTFVVAGWGQPVDEQVTHFCGADYSIETHFRVMDDGSMWRWTTFSGMDRLFMALLAAIAGIGWSFLITLGYGMGRVVQTKVARLNKDGVDPQEVA